jgi:hypothetical protein
MATHPSPTERLAFGIFWKWLTGDDICDADVDAMANPKDPPDFVFSHNGTRVALEHTHVFRRLVGEVPGPTSWFDPLHDEAIQRRVCNQVGAIMNSGPSGGPYVEISITFNSCRAIKRRQESDVARIIVDIIRKRLGNGHPIPMQLHPVDLASLVPCASCVLITQSCGPTTVHRHTIGQVDEWGLNDVAREAATKAKVLPQYQSRFDQCWLLLGAGGSHHSQWIEPSPKACATGIQSEFSRVFLVDAGRRRGYEIHVVVPSDARAQASP